ncbi:MAG TPA: hypothetical protein VGJ63_07010 [Micromonosporaceae bacterium]
MKDQRELVEDERRPNPEHARHRGPPSGQIVRNRQGGNTGDQDEDDPEHHMLDVQPARRDVPWPPSDLGADHPDREPDSGESQNHAGEET